VSSHSKSSHGKTRLSEDLLADLSAPGALPTASAPAALGSSVQPPRGTPALSVTLTPLRWRALALAAPERGTGVAVRVGPLRVELAF
jgi:hypothetical protein